MRTTLRASELFAAYQSGESARLAELVELLTPLLWHTARAQNAPRELAEDAVQTAWLRLTSAAGTIHDPVAVTSWLVVTVRREAWRLLRLTRRESEPEGGLPDRASGTTPEEEALLNARQRVLWSHVDALGDRCGQLLRVIAFAPVPDYAGVAASLGMPVGSIGPTRGRCLAKLRTALDDDPEWEN